MASGAVKEAARKEGGGAEVLEAGASRVSVGAAPSTNPTTTRTQAFTATKTKRKRKSMKSNRKLIMEICSWHAED